MSVDINRREALSAMAAALGSATLGRANEASSFVRVNPRIKGLSLSSYSMRESMRWRWGNETDRPMTMPSFFTYAAELGLDAVEPTSYFFPKPTPPRFISALRRQAHLLGLDISSSAMGNDFSWPPGSDRGSENMRYAFDWIDRFADLGAPAIRVFAARRPPKDLSEEQLVENVTANLGEAVRYAERRGVMLALENHDLVRRPDLLMRIVNSVDSSWLGVCWDSGNLVATPDPYADLATLAPRAVIAQIKASIPVNGEETEADYARLVALLREAQYAGYLVFEYEEEPDPYDAIPRHLARLHDAI